MGGIAVDERMASRVPGLFAGGEAAGGANGANRLSGNAIPEALVFGEQAGRAAAGYAARRKMPDWPSGAGAAAADQIHSLAAGRKGDIAAVELLEELREVMWRDVGPLRTADGLARGIARLAEIRTALPEVAVPSGRQFNAALAEWFELRGSLVAAEAVARAAAARTESRGAHQRDDFPDIDPAWAYSQRLAMTGDGALIVDTRR
jgi:succinate dehydrogenase/fumarate reductase flavoprotein subunit